MPKFIDLPVIDMREEPKERSKVVSQALFGEEIGVQQEKGGWFLIQTPDGYQGWIQKGFTDLPEYRKEVEVTRLKAHLFEEPDTEYGPVLSLPYGSGLKVVEEWDPRWLKVELPSGKEAFVQRGDLVAEPFDLTSFCQKFLGLPYTWGGRSSFGFDCSGFVQMVYGRMGICLPRDAREQVIDPRAKAVSWDALQRGDLIFWGKSAAEVRHVGMFLEKDSFIHTSVQENRPYLRISRLSDEVWRGPLYPYKAARRWL